MCQLKNFNYHSKSDFFENLRNAIESLRKSISTFLFIKINDKKDTG